MVDHRLRGQGEKLSYDLANLVLKHARACSLRYIEQGRVDSREFAEAIDFLKATFLHYYEGNREHIDDLSNLMVEEREKEEVSTASRNINAILDEANRLFDSSNWSRARVLYNKALNKMKELSFSNKKYLIAQTKFNIAMTYWNEKEILRSRELLLEIQGENPEYEPELIKERLTKLQEFEDSGRR